MKKILWLIVLQISIFIYTLGGIASKFASMEESITLKFLALYLGEIVILGIYAIIWQQVIARIDLSIAYANKGAALIWSLIWAIAIFDEKVTAWNIIGIVIVMIGIGLVNSRDNISSKEEYSPLNENSNGALVDGFTDNIKEDEHE